MSDVTAPELLPKTFPSTPDSSVPDIREQFRNPAFLPTHADLKRVFQMGDDWLTFCSEKNNIVFEYWNQEYIHALGGYLEQRVTQMETPHHDPVRIVEVGAGDGKLTYFLRKELDARIPGKSWIIATEPGFSYWDIHRLFPVEQLDSKSAVEKYKPEIVLCSWMPLDEDFTADFRIPTNGVQEYILIGEVDGGCCGDDRTWGDTLYKLNQEEHLHLANVPLPPYMEDHFERIDLDELSKHQLSRVPGADNMNCLGGYNSQTVSFRRLP